MIEDLPVGEPVRFAVELNLAAMAGHAEDRYLADPLGCRLGLLDARLDLPHAEGLDLVDEWLDLGVSLRWSVPSGLWCFPIETASQSEGGFEGLYQSTAVIPHWRIAADESRLARAMHNVIDNAIKASPEGAKVSVTLASGADAVSIEIRDRGPGVAADTAIFEPFVTTRVRGVGLGLPVARRIAEQHGGTLVAENHPSGGAVFTFRLPTVRE